MTKDDKYDLNVGWARSKLEWEKSHFLWFVAGAALGFLLALVLVILMTIGDVIWVVYFANGIWPELIGLLIGVFAIYRLDQWRDELREKERLKNDLHWQARSHVEDVAVLAIERIVDENWHSGDKGILKGIDFKGKTAHWPRCGLPSVNLEKARMSNAILHDANLNSARMDFIGLSYANLNNTLLPYVKLKDADLYKAILQKTVWEAAELQWTVFQEADLTDATLYRAKLHRANLIQAKLINTYLFCADLMLANLSGADLRNAYLLGANIEGVIWHSDDFGPAIMPDGTLYDASQDLLRFVDPNHPNLFIPAKHLQIMGTDGIERDKDNARRCINKREQEATQMQFWIPKRHWLQPTTDLTSENLIIVYEDNDSIIIQVAVR